MYVFVVLVETHADLHHQILTNFGRHIHFVYRTVKDYVCLVHNAQENFPFKMLTVAPDKKILCRKYFNIRLLYISKLDNIVI